MVATPRGSPSRQWVLQPESPGASARSVPRCPRATAARDAPIVAAIEPRTAQVTAETAAGLARELAAPLAFVHARPRPPELLGKPYYQRRLTRDLFRARRSLDTALAEARRHGVMAYGEIVEGDPAGLVLEFARSRHARLLVVGSRRRRFGRSVSRRVIRASDLPVVVAEPAAA
jgi:nucleotide-binding universal stress UspA family protein